MKKCKHSIIIAGTNYQFTIIPGCYLSLYDDPNAPKAWSQLVLAYSRGGRITLGQDDRRFRSPQLIPNDIWARKQQMDVVVEPLYFREDQIGFVLFETGQQDDDIHKVLRRQLNSALHGVQLVKQVQDDARELAAAYKEIRTLNDQRKKENLRMSVELDISGRIQQMVLPLSDELQRIEGVDIVGYMQPTDEVGGDYYDMLPKNGTIQLGIGDVTGHGLESGIAMLMTQTAIRTLIEHGETDPVVFLDTLNRTVYKNSPRDLKRKAVAKATMQGVTLTDILIEFLEGYAESFEVSDFEEKDEEGEPALALVA